jgi:hypothetical protein
MRCQKCTSSPGENCRVQVVVRNYIDSALYGGPVIIVLKNVLGMDMRLGDLSIKYEAP